MTAKPTAALPDPVRSSHVDVVEPADWRDRGSASDLTTQLWHTKEDFGAHTRFGFGWGPVEVIRSVRNGDVRIIDVVVAGKLAAAVQVHDESSRVLVTTDRSPATENLEPSDEVTGRLKELRRTLKDELTDRRREKKYVTRGTIDAIDEIMELINGL